MAAKTFEEVMKSSPTTVETTVPQRQDGDSFSVFKTDDDKRLVFGWASISITVDGEQLEDRQKDIIDPEDLEEAAYEYVLNFRDTGEEHISTMRKKGKLVESCVFTAEKQKAIGIPEGILPIGWWIGFKIEDDAAWEKVKNGTYKMFSIEGKANRVPVEKSRRDYDEYPSYGMWLEENLDTTIEEQRAAEEHYRKQKTVAKTFEEVLKFNPFHDAKGRFASSNSFASYSANPKTKAGAMAISRSAQGGHGATFNAHRESMGESVDQNYKWLNGGPGAKQLAAQGQLASQQPKQPQKPKKNYDARGFADHDDAGYHQLYNGRQYYKQQNLSVQEQNAAANYLSPNPEHGSLYSHCQNMNYMMATGQTLTGTYKKTHDGMMSAMHNIGYNVELTRYDHAGFLNGMLKTLGAGTNYEKMSQASLKKALVGQTVNENKFLSASYNNFKNAANASVFTSRAVKINYKCKANTQAMMPGVGPGGDFGEIVLAPTNGKGNKGGKITDIRLTGKMARRQGTQTYNQPQIEIDIEIG